MMNLNFFQRLREQFFLKESESYGGGIAAPFVVISVCP